MQTGSAFDYIVDQVEKLTPDDQEALLDLLRRRASAQRRADIAASVQQARQDYQEGRVCSGTVDQLMAELEE